MKGLGLLRRTQRKHLRAKGRPSVLELQHRLSLEDTGPIFTTLDRSPEWAAHVDAYLLARGAVL